MTTGSIGSPAGRTPPTRGQKGEALPVRVTVQPKSSLGLRLDLRRPAPQSRGEGPPAVALRRAMGLTR